VFNALFAMTACFSPSLQPHGFLVQAKCGVFALAYFIRPVSDTQKFASMVPP
jgi:hypothetical protein